MTPFTPSAGWRTVALAAALVAGPAQAQLVNGGFETGDLSGWTLGGDTGFIGVAEAIGRSGNFGAFFGPENIGSIAQSFATVAGVGYRVNFWLALDDSAVPNSFSWSWNGATQGLVLTDAAAFNYTSFSLVVTASSALSTLQFNFSNPASFWRLDDVAVSVVPEAPSHALMALGLLAVAAAHSLRHGRA